MATLTLDLPPRETRTAFNLRRWAEILADPDLARMEGRIETDRHGRIIVMPPPAPSHGSYQSEISHLLRTLLAEGRVMTECPVSTADGVKGADVAWASPGRMKELGKGVCFINAPEICVEVISPGNTRSEIEEKKALYFDAGAEEVWICGEDGSVSFFCSAVAPVPASIICPNFPQRVILR
jgi:Uma2 family endonuclease